MKQRTVGMVFMTRLVAFRGQNKKQAENAKGEVLSIVKEEMREDIQEGDTVICRVEERTAWLRDEQGDIVLDENGKEQSAGTFTRNEVIAFGTAQEMAQRFYADDILDAEAADIVQETIAAARKARVAIVAPVVKVVENAEPVMG